MYSVYLHECPNGKVYIGMTSKEPKIRWQHRYMNNRYFTKAIEKYGWDNIRHIVLMKGLTQEEAEKLEVLLIQKYNSTNPQNGYNIAKGGKSNTGFHHSVETKNKIRNSLKGIKHTEERIKHQKESKLKQWQDAEYRRKVSEAHKGKMTGKDNPKAKKVSQYDLQGNHIRDFACINDIERELGIDHRMICDCCKGRQKTCKGYVWKYTTQEV